MKPANLVLTLLRSKPGFAALEREHKQWLAHFDAQYLRNWENLRENDYEAAMMEAAVRRFLQHQGADVEPNEDLQGNRQRPDFRCTNFNAEFFVEVACISAANAAKETHLPYPAQSGPRFYRPLNNAIWKACKGKTKQCSDAGGPSLVAIGTFHDTVSDVCFSKAKVEMLLTGETKITFNLYEHVQQSLDDIYLSTELYSSAFLRREDTEGVGPARSSISGLVLCGFGVEPSNVRGILHPIAARPFDPGLLPGICFCSVYVDSVKHAVSTNWCGGDDS